MSFVVDAFSDTDNTHLEAHTGATGAAWTLINGLAVIMSNRLIGGTGGANLTAYSASGTPAGVGYTVQSDLVFFTDMGFGATTYVLARVQGAAGTYYAAGYNGSQWALYKYVANTGTLLGTSSVGFSGGDLNPAHTYQIQLIVTAGTQTFKVNDNGAGFTTLITASDTDASLAGAGLAGVAFYPTMSSSTGVHLANYTANDNVAAATGYSLSGPSSGNINQASTNFTVTLTPSGGTSAGVTITPHSTLGGSFSPATVNLSTGTPSATFTYTPTSAGAATISGTNSGSLTDPSTLTYTVAATYLIQANQSKFDLFGLFPYFDQGDGKGPYLQLTLGNGGYVNSHKCIQFVGNFTALTMQAYSNATNTFKVSIDNGADISIAGTGLANYSIASGLSAGNHMVRVDSTDFHNQIASFGLAGGTSTIVGSGKAVEYLASSIAGTNAPNRASVIAMGGAHAAQDGSYEIQTGRYSGFSQQVKFTGTGVYALCLTTDTQMAVAIDGGAYSLVSIGSSPSFLNILAMVPLAAGLAAGTHTLEAIFLGDVTSGGEWVALMATNGTTLVGGVSATGTSITVAGAAGYAVGDWLTIDNGLANLEHVKVTSVSGTTLGVTALAYNHSSGVEVTNAKDTPGSFSAWSRQALTLRIATMGDSITQGANPQDVGGFVNYDPRFSFLYRACQALGYDALNLGIQGTTLADPTAGFPAAMEHRSATDWALYAPNADAYCILGGTNDINGGGFTPAQIQSGAQSTLLNTLAVAGYGGRPIYIFGVFTPPAGGSGSSIAQANAAIQAAVNLARAGAAPFSGPARNVWYVTLSPRLILAPYTQGGDLDTSSIHPVSTGHIKLGQALARLLAKDRLYFGSFSDMREGA